jgi:hypothetical protein
MQLIASLVSPILLIHLLELAADLQEPPSIITMMIMQLQRLLHIPDMMEIVKHGGNYLHSYFILI